MPIPLGTIVTLTFKFQRKGTSNAATGERMYTYERTFTSNANYNNIKDFWDGLSIGETLNFGTNTGNLCSSGMDNIYIPDTFASGSPAGAFAGYPD